MTSMSELRSAILAVHRTLLDAERVAYERLFGRIETSGELLRLVIHDPWFGWLRPITALIAAMDEPAADDDDPELQAAELRATTRELLHPVEDGSDFQKRYFEMMQASPDVVIAHVQMVRILDRP